MQEKERNMFTVIFIIALVWLVWKIIVLGLRATWGVAKLVCTVLLLPGFLILLVCAGLMYIAMPLLIIAGVFAMIRGMLTK